MAWRPRRLPVKRALEKLGADISDARRRRRRIPMALMAERAGIGRMTLVRIEQGDPAVSIGAYARVLFMLGLTTRLDELDDASHDATGLALEEEPTLSAAALARRTYGSFATAWHVQRDFALLSRTLSPGSKLL
jgi:transcriptional regulator with XRE-family HTH domain